MKNINLATTTSAQDSGLLNMLLPKFESASSFKVSVRAVGSGMAMELANKGEADVLLVHDPEGEEGLVNSGVGISRKLVMHNDFILVGPHEDPARIKNEDFIIEAFKKIAQAKTVFVSRGDSSGTDKREKQIWQKSGINTGDINYHNTKSGMAETLTVTSAKKGYTLTDRATFMAHKQELNLDIMVEGDDLLLNLYHVIQVNPNKFPQVNAEGAKQFADFLLSPSAQEIIAKHMRDKYGHSLFIPDAGKSTDDVRRSDWKQQVIYS